MSRRVRIAPTVATLERQFAEAVETLDESDELVVEGMPIPSLDPSAEPADGSSPEWTYRAPVGAARAVSDETHRLALIHPLYDGFLTLDVRARVDLEEVRVVPDERLARVVTPQHRLGPLRRGQHLPVDLELHPGSIDGRAADGMLRIVDGSSADLAPAVRLTIATDAALDCVLAGAVEGPWRGTELSRICDELACGDGAPRRLARRIAAVEAGRADPGWSRLPWSRR